MEDSQVAVPVAAAVALGKLKAAKQKPNIFVQASIWCYDISKIAISYCIILIRK